MTNFRYYHNGTFVTVQACNVSAALTLLRERTSARFASHAMLTKTWKDD